VKRRGVLLDRDGTLVDFVRDPELGSVVSAFHPDQLRLLPGVLDGLRLLAEGGFVLAIATNQPGAAKGQIPREAIARTNDALVARLRSHGIPIARLAACLHHPDGGPGGDPALVGPCACRKPAPGLLLDLVGSLDLDPTGTFMVGDSLVDVEAGRAAGLRTALLFEHGRCESCPVRPDPGGAALPCPDLVAPRLDAVARAIVGALP
jgi:D-glycero-D-manno-heptose 1,7-bisphosphate phosphatase